MLRTLFLTVLLAQSVWACPPESISSETDYPGQPDEIGQLRRALGFTPAKYRSGVVVPVNRRYPFPARVTELNMGNFGAPAGLSAERFVSDAIEFAESPDPHILTLRKKVEIPSGPDREKLSYFLYYRFDLRGEHPIMVLSRRLVGGKARILIYYSPREEKHPFSTNIELVWSLVRYSTLRFGARIPGIAEFNFSSERKLVEHFEKHGHRVGAGDVADYLKKSRWAGMNRDGALNVLSIRSRNKTVVFDPIFGTLLVVAEPSRRLHTYHRIERELLENGTTVFEYFLQTLRGKHLNSRES